MKKTYHNSPVPFFTTFALFSVAAFSVLIGQSHFWGNEVNYLEVVGAVGILLFLGWASLFLTINSKTITRRLAIIFVTVRNVSEVDEIRQVSDSDIYGTSRTMQLRFTNGDRWNLGLLNKKDMRELIDDIRKHQKQK